jgi:hypothetical protein
MTCDHSNDPEDQVARAMARAVRNGSLPMESVESVLATIVMAKEALKVSLMGELDEMDEGFLAFSISELCRLLDRIRHYLSEIPKQQQDLN